MKHLPLSLEIPYEDPGLLFQNFSDKSWAIFLDSADSDRQRDDTNRCSYIVFEPFEKILIKRHQRVGGSGRVSNPFQYLNAIMQAYAVKSDPQLPVFQGGAVGYFSYDLCHYYEDINRPIQQEDSPYADLAVGLYDTVISFDHVLKKAWIVSNGFSESSIEKQRDRAESNIQYCLDLLRNQQRSKDDAPCFRLKDDLISPFDKSGYGQLVEKAKNYILEGDIFEVNLSHRFEGWLDGTLPNKYDLYLNMRTRNPSPFSAYLNFNDHHILSTSPERFLLLREGIASTRPIKGTARRGQSQTEDRLIAELLAKSEKDRSENVMIVDLLRNDLSKVCLADSVKVKKLCGIETYPTVHHLVSIIEGKLRSDAAALELLEACFPGGSITGAPKVRAMQIIYELEPTARGPYCGSIGYIGFNGSMDTSIVIRTLLVDKDNKITYQAGGAVVLDSSPVDEYEETLTKSASIRKVFSKDEVLA